MPYSKFKPGLEFNEREWAVSLINTKVKLSELFGGHAKIVVEGVRKRSDGLLGTELFIGEYHIMERGRLQQPGENNWIPQALRNTQSKYSIIIGERNDYSARQEQQYAEVQARTEGGLDPREVMRMIHTIKQEDADIHEGKIEADFQYAGARRWHVFSYNGGHNCTTWAEAQLDIIGIGKHPITDSSKASPVIHVNMGGWCAIL